MSDAETILRELVDAARDIETQLGPTKRRAASPGFIPAVRRLALAWQAARIWGGVAKVVDR